MSKNVRWMIPVTLFCLLLGIFLSSAHATALPVTTFSALNVELWPEFDRSALLVILHGEINTTGPISITLPLPAQAEVNAVAFRDENNRLLQARWQLQRTHNGQNLIISAGGNALQVEFYLPMTTTGGKHRFKFTFGPLPYPVAKATISVQKPAQAENLQGVPPLTGPEIGSYNLSYYRRQLGALPAGATIQQEIVYDKQDASLTTDVLGLAATRATATPDQSATLYSPPPGRSVLLLRAGLLALLASLGLIAYTVWRYRLFHPQREQKRKSNHEKFDMSMKYCRRCGHPFGPGDHYCTRCGAPRR